jgi:hypothetical protein
MNKISKYTLLALTFCFAMFGAVQYNDSDWYLWIPVYLIATAICFMAYQEKVNNPLTIFAMLAYFAGGIFLWPSEYKGVFFDMSYAPEIELARESLGALICGMGMAFVLFTVKGKTSTKNTTQEKTKEKVSA